MVFSRSRSRYFTSIVPSGSSTPPRARGSANISINRGLIDVSRTTHAPPRSSPSGGIYTNTGLLYSRNASTIRLPNLRTSSNISRIPPEKPRQFAKMNSGRFSLSRSLMVCAVLCAESGYHTCPACMLFTSFVSGEAGSAGTNFSTLRVSTETTPTGIPPSRARPHTTVLAHPARDSRHEPLSNSPDSPSALPASMCRGS
mmetsp:Transcript_14912/g.40017  ORF Transcript_14912/g.40017 Transcript_14912/m.40017 type:complete len:200 (+) Transcript_14912:878-1477(+)